MMARAPVNGDDTAASSGRGRAEVDLEAGEELGDVDQETWRAIERQSQLHQHDNTRRLSRE